MRRRKFKRKVVLCACGCGKPVKKDKDTGKWNTYINGHQCMGKKCSEETRRKIGEGNRGKKCSSETRKKMSIAGKGKGRGKIVSSETRKKLSIAGRGKIFSEETRRKMSEIKQNMSDETRKKISEALKGKYTGENSPNWQGGVSCEPYCPVWTDEEYKDSIRERDGKCMNPDCRNNINPHRKLSIHHINFTKKDCHPKNLITVCTSCNARANTNRKWHTQFYQKIMTKLYGYEYPQEGAK